MSYGISDEYNARIGATQEFERESKLQDEYQNTVYETARQIANDHHYRTILDLGTGGGYKLMKFFEDFDTIGVDLPDAVLLLNKKYPHRRWAVKEDVQPPVDLVIFSDVIEHVDDPDVFCEYIKSMKPGHIVISTPDRNLVCAHTEQPELGPPRNSTHVREWAWEEFKEYMESHFNVERIFYSNVKQYTMCVIATLK